MPAGISRRNPAISATPDINNTRHFCSSQRLFWWEQLFQLLVDLKSAGFLHFQQLGVKLIFAAPAFTCHWVHVHLTLPFNIFSTVTNPICPIPNTLYYVHAYTDTTELLLSSCIFCEPHLQICVHHAFEPRVSVYLVRKCMTVAFSSNGLVRPWCTHRNSYRRRNLLTTNSSSLITTLSPQWVRGGNKKLSWKCKPQEPSFAFLQRTFEFW